MSGIQIPPTVTPKTPADRAVAAAQSLPQLVDKLQVAAPGLAQTIIGKALAESRTPWGTFLLPVVLWLSARYGLGWDAALCTAVAGTVALACSYAMRLITSGPITGFFHRGPIGTPVVAAASGDAKP